MKNLIQVRYGQTGRSQAENALGMRPMQARVWGERAAQHLLVKAPPASGKSRALMFVGLDKIINQGLAKVVVSVPERSIGASFRNTDLTSGGFFSDWSIKPGWNLCAPGGGGNAGKVDALARFLASGDRTLVCTHATLRFAYERLGAEAFDDCVLAIDEFHHVRHDDESRLGGVVRGVLNRGSAHIVAMTGSYFRGDSEAILSPEDESRFERVTYTYYEQLEGYRHLRTLGIGYHFYRGRYLDALPEVLDTDKKTIVHIPNVNAAEALGDKYVEVGTILDMIGVVEVTDPVSGFLHVRRPDGRLLKVADLVEDDPTTRSRVVEALRASEDRDAVDIIIALGMAKEGFDWIWCEHALTVGYRSSLTEIVQIIGRATRDAPGKSHAQFTNLIAEPLAQQGEVVTAVNDMLKAISASLLMEQVLAPRFRFHARPPEDENGQPLGDGQGNFFYDEATGEAHITIRGFEEPSTPVVQAILDEDLNDLVAAVCQDPRITARAIADDATAPEVVNQVLIPRVIEERYPDLTPVEVEQIRQRLVAGLAVIAEAGREAEPGASGEEEDGAGGSARFVNMVRRFVNVRELNIDLIDQINPFQRAYEVLSKSLDAPTLSRVHGAIAEGRIQMTEEEAVALWPRIQTFRNENGREPSTASQSALEKRLGEALVWLRARKRERMAAAAGA